MKKFLVLFLLLLIFKSNAQELNSKPVEVLTLGVFHFNFPNLDVKQIEKSDQIDVLDKKHQDEILNIVNKIAEFDPTIIVIENSPKNQHKIDSTLNLYLQNKYELGRREDEQIGFRLAKVLRLNKLYCVDEWGDFDSEIERIISGTDTTELQRFVKFVNYNPDKDKITKDEPVYKLKGITEEIKRLNDPEHIKKSLGAYLIGAFKYESTPGDFAGVKFETGRWFNRNLKIFRNIQRIKVNTDDKILVIYGSGHLNLLNMFFESSPEYKLSDINDYLK